MDRRGLRPKPPKGPSPTESTDLFEVVDGAETISVVSMNTLTQPGGSKTSTYEKQQPKSTVTKITDTLKDLDLETTNRPSSSPLPSLPLDPNSLAAQLKEEDIVWISAVEGLTAHFDMMRRLLNIVNLNKRTLVVAAYKSPHYPGLKAVNICDYFVLPDNIRCTSVRRNLIVNQLSCTTVSDETVNDPETFGLYSNFSVAKLPEVDWKSSKCVISTGRSKIFANYAAGTVPALPIVFTPDAVGHFKETRDTLFPLGKSSSQVVYTAVHWRRSALTHHQPCRHNDDEEALNCGPASKLIERLQSSSKKKLGEVYISTNERRPEVLDEIRKANYKLLVDARTLSSTHMTSLDAFVVDLQMMINSENFIYFGKSGVRNFVERARAERLGNTGNLRSQNKGSYSNENTNSAILVLVVVAVVTVLSYVTMKIISFCCDAPEEQRPVLRTTSSDNLSSPNTFYARFVKDNVHDYEMKDKSSEHGFEKKHKKSTSKSPLPTTPSNTYGTKAGKTTSTSSTGSQSPTRLTTLKIGSKMSSNK